MTRVRKLLRDDLKSYQARAEAVRTAQIYREYYAIARCPSENLDSPTVIGAQAANELLNIAGAQVKASQDEVERMLKDIIDQEYQEENTK